MDQTAQTIKNQSRLSGYNRIREHKRDIDRVDSDIHHYSIQVSRLSQLRFYDDGSVWFFFTLFSLPYMRRLRVLPKRKTERKY